MHANSKEKNIRRSTVVFVINKRQMEKEFR
jgi:ribosomal protein L36